MRKLDLVGSRFGRLTVTDALGKDNAGRLIWDCLCDCGNRVTKYTLILRTGKSQSCGCLRKEAAAAHARSMTTHGHWVGGKATREYAAWASMKGRCLNLDHADYERYGGRGVQVCERWLEFQNFYADMGDSPGKGYSIDRRDNSKGYEPSNCRWATYTEQNNNTRFNRMIEHGGKVQSLASWVREVGIRRDRFNQEAKKLGDDELALAQLISQLGT